MNSECEMRNGDFLEMRWKKIPYFSWGVSSLYFHGMQQRTIHILSIAFFLGLLLWGGYVTLVYVGIPLHGAVYASDGFVNSLKGMCGDDGYVCRGFFSLYPLIARTLARTAPFLGYMVLWFLIALAFVGASAFHTGEFRFRVTLAPWKVLLAFVLAVWTMFTVFSYGQIGDTPLRRIAEPLPGVYKNVGEEGIAELQQNFQRLQKAGCLSAVGRFGNGAGVYDLSTICMQGFFFSRVLSNVLWVVFFLAELMVFGHAILRRFRLSMTPLTECVLSAGLGAGAWITVLWFLAVMHLFETSAIWTALVIVPVLCYRSVLHWAHVFVRERWEVDLAPWSPVLLLSWLLLSYLALNFLSVVRPFPIGWDDLGSYLNRPNLLVSYGHFIHSMSPFQWEYLTAIGFATFGFGSPVGATASMMINWSQGVLAVLVIIAFARTYLGKGAGILSGLLYYSLPLVGHFSYADMKIDNAVFTMGALATFALFMGLLPPNIEEGSAQEPSSTVTYRWMIIAGVLGGFAFSMKVTAIMVVLALGIVLSGVLLHWSAAIGATALAVVVLVTKGGLDIAAVGKRIFGEGTEIGTQSVLLILLLIGVSAGAFAIVNGRKNIRRTLLAAAMLIGGFFITIAPWIAHNNIQSGHILPRGFLLGAPNTISVQMQYKSKGPAISSNGVPVRSLPPDLAIDPNHPACKGTGSSEELGRYWGYSVGWKHYLTLPWRTVMNLDSAGYYVTTMPALLLFPLLLLLPYFWTKRGRWLRWMAIATVFILLQWMFMANGIPWYGIGVLLGLILGVEALVVRSPDILSMTLVSVLVAISLFSNFANRFWQFEQQRNLFEYPIGKASAEVMRERTIPHYDDIADAALQLYRTHPERPYLYRVGTFIPYFIPKNLEVIGLADHQLDVFNCLYQERDSVKMTKRLKALGFSSLIFDTNTATIEQDPKGSLHQKVQALIDYLNDPKSGLQILINDPGGGVAYLVIP